MTLVTNTTQAVYTRTLLPDNPHQLRMQAYIAKDLETD